MAALLGLAVPQGMPVTRLAGGGPQTVAPAPVPQPRQPEGSLPSAVPPLAQPPAGMPVTQIDPRDTTLDSPRRVTLTFAEPRPIEEVLQLLIAGTPFSLSIDPGADGMFRGELKQLTLREALTALLAPLGLGFTVQGTVLRITNRQADTRLFDLNLLSVRRAMHRTAGTPDASITSSAGPDDVFSAIGEGVKALLSETGRVHIDHHAGLAQVTDYPERLDRVALYIEALQQRSGRQVRLQAQVFEVTLSDAASIDWRLVRAKVGLPDAPATALAADPAALRAALAAQGAIRDLWAPDVTALNNEPALVRISTPGGTSLTMTVVPQIAADGIVQLSVSHAWEERAGERSEGLFKSSPVMRLSEADTVARVLDGHTVMISGLLRPQMVAAEGGGRTIFGSQPKKPGHAELVVLLRASVVTLGTKD